MTNGIEASQKMKHVSLAQRLGIHTENPFTQTRAKRIGAIFFDRNVTTMREIRDNQRSAKKRSQWHFVMEKASAPIYNENNQLDVHDPVVRKLVKENLATVLRISDASQGEIDFLTKGGKDPKPLHKINYDAGNNPDREVTVVFSRELNLQHLPLPHLRRSTPLHLR